MLYLKLFLETIIKNPIRGFGFLISGFVLSILLGQSEGIQNNIMSSLPKVSDGPHFFALIDKTINVQGIRRKLMNLPGVKAVRNIPSAELNLGLKNILGDVGIDLSSSIETPNVSGISIFFSPQLEARSQKLIKKYLSRLTGEEKVTLGPTIGGGKKLNEWTKSFKNSLNLKVGSIVLAHAVLRYLVFGITLGNELGQKAYLIEKFSRRRNVIQVTAGIGFIGASFIMMSPSLLFGSANYIGLLAFLSLSLIFYITTVRRGWSTS